MNISIAASLDRPDVCPKTFSVITRFLTTAALVLLTACSKSSPSSTSSPNATPAPQASSVTSGPCSLITQTEAEAALGKGTTINPNHNPRTDMDECRLKPGHAPGIEEIIILVHPATGWDMVKKSLMEKPVPGLGDDAFVARALGYNVRKGNNYVQVFGPVTNENAANDKATRYLAERASSRL
ncbi:MAG TPA: hypothetical protein VI488_12560 [Candidatus Angelobacter sp.]